MRVANTGTAARLPVRTVEIGLDGAVLARRTLVLPLPGLVPETFDVGRDDATSVSEDYAPNTEFPGKLDSVVFQFPAGD